MRAISLVRDERRRGPISAVARVEDMIPHSIVIVGTRLIAHTPGVRRTTVTRDPLDEQFETVSAKVARDFFRSPRIDFVL